MTKNSTTNYQNTSNLTPQMDINVTNEGQSKASFATFGPGMTAHLQSWLTALQKANDLLPQQLRFDDVQLQCREKQAGQISLSLIEQLETLPVFALSVVVQKQALITPDNADTDQKAAFEAHIDDWARQNPSWQIIRVTHTVDALQDISGSDRLTPVLTYRYVLMPTDTATMQPGKKAAAARLLDDGMTSHLRQFIATLPITENLGGDAAIDCHIVSLAKMLRPHKVAVFDMDSTLIEQEVIVELAKHANIGDQVSEITESAMRGEIDFDTSFSQRVALLEGLSTDVLDEIQQSLTFSAGARTLMATLKSLDYHTVLVSGGFTYFAERIAQELGIDEVYANELDIEADQVTGNVRLPIINGERKASLVQQVAERMGISTAQVICVGDGANDLPMMAIADLGVAYHAKPIVRGRADAAINATGLEGVLYVLGYSAQDLR
ncbi:phosphoserine phosphatase SerB [Psychrobacter sp. FDAARGOS_221]|uniref:phosphoserine phosphatase SerB n=1 Tax=Psychrobacter sp. FDAARGOS_221 TaxID=1975705 RepID=UPI000BB53694|nr:phosphoserine phosphatase SerB [Psychrobacter sp. FDAARGOS_221]PNK60957.1 phosphoserine phosphatase SerB [Psychrobacter sp. FDAARGOS_221]